MAKRNRVSRRERMIANAIEKMKDHDIYVISEKFIGDYGYISPDMDIKELRYVAGLLSSLPLYEDVELNKTQWDHYCSVVHHVNGVTVILDKGSKKIGNGFFVNPRGNVFMIEFGNNNTHYFNWKVSKFIMKNRKYLDLNSIDTVEEIEACYNWDKLLRKILPVVGENLIMKEWYYNSSDSEYYSYDKILDDRDGIALDIADSLSRSSLEYLEFWDGDRYICSANAITGHMGDDFPDVWIDPYKK